MCVACLLRLCSILSWWEGLGKGIQIPHEGFMRIWPLPFLVLSKTKVARQNKSQLNLTRSLEELCFCARLLLAPCPYETGYRRTECKSLASRVDQQQLSVCTGVWSVWYTVWLRSFVAVESNYDSEMLEYLHSCVSLCLLRLILVKIQLLNSPWICTYIRSHTWPTSSIVFHILALCP